MTQTNKRAILLASVAVGCMTGFCPAQAATLSSSSAEAGQVPGVVADEPSTSNSSNGQDGAAPSTAPSGNAAAPVSVAAGQGAAQPASPSKDADIIVTAQKREQRLTDVPLSITAATGKELQDRGVTTPNDLGKISPGFSFQKSAYEAPVFTIRGIGLFDNFFALSPTVTVYVDQVPLPYLAMTEGASLDVERVEILKGPQGTLFGQNSTGGAINFIAAKPTAKPKAGFDLTYGRFNEIDGQAFVSGPISETLKARFVVRHENRGDWQYSVTRPDDGHGQRNFTDARLLLDWTPADSLRFQLNANAWWDRSDTQAGQFRQFDEQRPSTDDIPPELRGDPQARLAIGNLPTFPSNARAADWDPDRDFRNNNRFKQISLRSDIDLTDSLKLTSLSSYIDHDIHSLNDNDGTAYHAYVGLVVGSTKSFFQELRLAGNLSNRIKFTAGGNYEYDNIKGNLKSLAFFNSTDTIGPFQFHSFGQRTDQKVTTLAGFGALDYELTNHLTLQGSARYTDQQRKLSGCLEDGGDGQLATALNFIQGLLTGTSDLAPPGGCVTLNALTFRRVNDFRDSLHEHNLSWRGGVNWKPEDNVLLYANVTKGYKSGTYTALPAILTSQFTPIVQESVVAYEVGAKAAPWDRRAQLSGALFYYDYRDKQLLGTDPTPFGLLQALKNIPKSHAEGGEIEVTLRPLDHLHITAGATYTKTRVDRAGQEFTSPGGQPIDINGDAFPNTPKWQLVADSQYEMPISNDLQIFLGGGVTYRSSTLAAFGGGPEFLIKSYALVDVRGGIETEDGRWRLQLWGRNILNKYYWQGVVRSPDTVYRLTGMPATYGLTVSARF